MGERRKLDVAIDGRRLEAVELPGDQRRDSIVLLHEGLGSVGLWRTFPEALRQVTGCRILAFSRYGHGRSSSPPSPRTASFFRDEAYDVLPALLGQSGLDDPILLGHSDGASIALIHAAAFPVRGIVLIAPHVVVEALTLAAIRETRARFEMGDLRVRLSRHHDDPDAVFHGWCDVWLDPRFREWTLELDAERVACPVLLIQGADDPYGSLAQLDRIEARVKGPVRRRVVPGGHSPHLEAEDTVVAEVKRFVDALREGEPT